MNENTNPLRLNGATFRADKTGLITIVQPWEVHTIEECSSFIPNPAPLNLPITDRSASEWEVGTWTLQLTFEGTVNDGEISFENADALEIELDTSMSQDPIKSHPNFASLKTKYGWDPNKEEFSETLASAVNAVDGNALTRDTDRIRNPLFGTDSYLALGAVFRITYTAARPPANVLEGIGTVVDEPPGWQLLGVPLLRGRNWLKLSPKVRKAGNACKIVSEYMLSGPNRWSRDIYREGQFNK